MRGSQPPPPPPCCSCHAAMAIPLQERTAGCGSGASAVWPGQQRWKAQRGARNGDAFERVPTAAASAAGPATVMCVRRCSLLLFLFFPFLVDAKQPRQSVACSHCGPVLPPVFLSLRACWGALIASKLHLQPLPSYTAAALSADYFVYESDTYFAMSWSGSSELSTVSIATQCKDRCPPPARPSACPQHAAAPAATSPASHRRCPWWRFSATHLPACLFARLPACRVQV